MDYSVGGGRSERIVVFIAGGFLSRVVVLSGFKDARDRVNTALDLVYFQQMTILISSSCRNKSLSIMTMTHVSR